MCPHKETVSGVHSVLRGALYVPGTLFWKYSVEDIDNEKLELSSGWGDRPWETSGTRMSHGDMYDGEKLSRVGEEGVHGRL